MSADTNVHVALVGGGMDPPHVNHLLMANRARLRGPQKVIFAPSIVKPGSSNELVRFDMVKLAIADNPYFSATSFEIELPGRVSIDTMRELRRTRGPNLRISFVLGEDNVPVLRDYDRKDEFLSLCDLLIAPRMSKAKPDTLKKLWQQMLGENARLEVIDFPANELSSTKIREWVHAGEPITYAVTPPVERYIIDTNLYKGTGSLSL